MARRSTKITLSNNTDQTLTLVGTAGPCQGMFASDVPQPPQTIAPKKGATWQTEDGDLSFLTGTECWVKYQINNPQAFAPELVYIHWNNPFFWSDSTVPIDFKVQTSEVTPPCDADKGHWDGGGSTFPHGGTNPPEFTHNLFLASTNPQKTFSGVTWADLVFNWPVLLGFTALGNMDIQLEFVVGLRRADSMDQTIFGMGLGPKGLRSVATAAKQTSLRKVFGF